MPITLRSQVWNVKEEVNQLRAGADKPSLLGRASRFATFQLLQEGIDDGLRITVPVLGEDVRDIPAELFEQPGAQQVFFQYVGMPVKAVRINEDSQAVCLVPGSADRQITAQRG